MQCITLTQVLVTIINSNIKNIVFLILNTLLFISLIFLYFFYVISIGKTHTFVTDRR